MNRFFWPLFTAVALLAGTTAQAQDKPALNTAPPGSQPRPTPPPQPQPTPAPTTPQSQPAPAPAPTPTVEPAPTQEPAAVPANTPRPTTDNPSGLDFPGRTKSTSGFGGPALTAKKMFVYTGFGLGFNSYGGLTSFNISAAPALGYRFSERFAAGPGISYAYQSYAINKSLNQTFPNGSRSVTTNSIGLKAFAQFMVYKQFFLHGEYEVTNAELIDERDFSTIKRTITTPLLGAGYRTEFSSNAAADIVVLYNFNDGIYSGFYGQPVIRFNFLFNIGRPTADR